MLFKTVIQSVAAVALTKNKWKIKTYSFFWWWCHYLHVPPSSLCHFLSLIFDTPLFLYPVTSFLNSNYLNRFASPPRPHARSFPMNTKILAEAKLRQCWKDVLRHFVKLRISNFATTFSLLCYNVSETLISNELTTSIQSYDVVKMSFCLLGSKLGNYTVTV